MMKINFVQTIIAIALSLLISYGLFSFHNSGNRILLSVGGFLFFALTLILTLGISFELSRTTTNVRLVSAIFFIVSMLSNLFFSFIIFSFPEYIITNGILILIFILIINSIIKAKQ